MDGFVKTWVVHGRCFGCFFWKLGSGYVGGAWGHMGEVSHLFWLAFV